MSLTVVKFDDDVKIRTYTKCFMTCSLNTEKKREIKFYPDKYIFLNVYWGETFLEEQKYEKKCLKDVIPINKNEIFIQFPWIIVK